MHLLDPTGPVTTCTGAPVETAAQPGADATANVLAVDCIPCLRIALVEKLRERDALRDDLAALRDGVVALRTRVKDALGALTHVVEPTAAAVRDAAITRERDEARAALAGGPECPCSEGRSVDCALHSGLPGSYDRGEETP